MQHISQFHFKKCELPRNNFDNNTIMIDRGASSGFKKGMPVVTRDGLIGRLETVTDKRSVVRLITDPDFAVSVKIASTGRYAQGHGNGALGLALSDDETIQFRDDLARGQVGHLRMVSTVRLPFV